MRSSMKSNLDDKSKNDLSSSEADSMNKVPTTFLVYASQFVRKTLCFVSSAVFSLKTFVLSLRQTCNGDSSGVTKDIVLAFSKFSFKKVSAVGVLCALCLYFLSGVYVVNPGEVAIVNTFGKPIPSGFSEGLHYRFPWPIQTINVVNVSTIRREGVGLLLPEHQSIHSSPDVVQFLTGDYNIIDIQAVAQYRIKDPYLYLYGINFRDCQLVNEVVRSAITEIGGGMLVDDILTVGKERLQEMIRTKAQDLLDKYRSGLHLVGINLNKVYPPEQVAEAFRDVSNAKQDLEKKINDAWGYRNTVIPQARADSVRLNQEADAYRAEVVNKANGEAGRFNKMLTEYNKDRDKSLLNVTATRLYLESLEKVLSKVNKYIVDPQQGGSINLRLMQKEQ